MDESQATTSASAPPSGGSVEPTNRTALAKEPRPKAKEEVRSTRYELHDPFMESTYRLAKFDDMVKKADELGAMRFTAVDAQGKRSLVTKGVDGWPKPEEQKQDKAQEPKAVERGDAQPTAKVVQLNPTTKSEPSRNAQAPHHDAAAERAAHVSNLEATLNERYVIKRAPVKFGDVSVGQTEYRYRGAIGRLAFTESTLRLSTDHNNPSVARSMVDVAEARDWKALRISGHDNFKRMVWLEASLRGVKTIGYEPVPSDMELLRKERDARNINRVEPDRNAEAKASSSASGTNKTSARGSGGRKAVLAALEAVLVAKNVPEKQREAVMSAAVENLSKRVAAGQTHKVKMFDKTVAPQRATVRTSPEPQRSREQTAPVR